MQDFCIIPMKHVLPAGGIRDGYFRRYRLLNRLLISPFCLTGDSEIDVLHPASCREADMFGKLRQWLACGVNGVFAPLSGQDVYPAFAKKLVTFQVLVPFMRGIEFHETGVWSFCGGDHQGHSFRHLDPV